MKNLMKHVHLHYSALYHIFKIYCYCLIQQSTILLLHRIILYFKRARTPAHYPLKNTEFSSVAYATTTNLQRFS